MSVVNWDCSFSFYNHCLWLIKLTSNNSAQCVSLLGVCQWGLGFFFFFIDTLPKVVCVCVSPCKPKWLSVWKSIKCYEAVRVAHLKHWEKSHLHTLQPRSKKKKILSCRLLCQLATAALLPWWRVSCAIPADIYRGVPRLAEASVFKENKKKPIWWSGRITFLWAKCIEKFWKVTQNEKLGHGSRRTLCVWYNLIEIQFPVFGGVFIGDRHICSRPHRCLKTSYPKHLTFLRCTALVIKLPFQKWDKKLHYTLASSSGPIHLSESITLYDFECEYLTVFAPLLLSICSNINHHITNIKQPETLTLTESSSGQCTDKDVFYTTLQSPEEHSRKKKKPRFGCRRHCCNCGRRRENFNVSTQCVVD